jgi:tetratricopeptide (TPR) repeat protein
MIDPRPLWDFDDPAGSEARFRALADEATGPDAGVLMTQVARALGLQGRYDEALAVLDGVPDDDDEVAVRVELEHGRVLRSSNDPVVARAWFDSAFVRADAAGLDELAVDALHMVALTQSGEEQLATTRSALDRARASAAPGAQAWSASLLHNLGMARADAGDWDGALAAFEEALDERRRRTDADATHVARWAVAWALRNLGRRDEALEEQRALKAELDAAGKDDRYVDQELALLTGEPDDS